MLLKHEPKYQASHFHWLDWEEFLKTTEGTIMALDIRTLNMKKICLHQTTSKKKIHMYLVLLFVIDVHSVVSSLQQ